jgi:hypothetical protein
MYLILCLIHQLSLVTGAVLIGFDMGKLQMVNALYCISMMFRATGNFISYLERLPAVIGLFLVIRRGEPDPSYHEYASLVMGINGWSLDDVEVANLLSVLNGPWWIQDMIIVYLAEDDDSTKEAVVKRIVLALCRTVFSSMPDVPMPSRWTKVSGSFSESEHFHGMA